MTPLVLIGALLACFICEGFFAAAEIALVVADPIKLRVSGTGENGASGDPGVARLVRDRDRTLALVLTVINSMVALEAALLTTALYQFGLRNEFLAPLILAPLVLLFGEVLPKYMGLLRADTLVRLAAPVIRILGFVLAPVVTVEIWVSRAMRKLMGVPAEAHSVFLTREDLALLATRGNRQRMVPKETEDAILPNEQLIIARAFRFSRTEARKAMVPLVAVEGIAADATIRDAIQTVHEQGFSRLPVFKRHIGDIIGVVHVYDLLEAPDLDRPVGEVARPVRYCSEATPLSELMVVMQRTGEGMAVVVDEYGGAAGIITFEDILEEIVGSIEDEYDVREELVRVVNPHTLAVSGRMPVAELIERFGLELPESSEYTTIGGLVMEKLGHIPRVGERLRINDMTISVTRSQPRSVNEVLIRTRQPLNAPPQKRQ